MLVEEGLLLGPVKFELNLCISSVCLVIWRECGPSQLPIDLAQHLTQAHVEHHALLADPLVAKMQKSKVEMYRA